MPPASVGVLLAGMKDRVNEKNPEARAGVPRGKEQQRQRKGAAEAEEGSGQKAGAAAAEGSNSSRQSTPDSSSSRQQAKHTRQTAAGSGFTVMQVFRIRCSGLETFQVYGFSDSGVQV
jgi:hypothetical protein